MGSFFSSPIARAGEPCESSQIEACKRLRVSRSSCGHKNSGLIPSLPDEISVMILARVPKIHYLSMKMVSQGWKSAITGREVFQLRKYLGLTEEWLYVLTKVGEERLLWHALDPVSGRWQKLPPMPETASEEEAKRGLSAFRIWNPLGSGLKLADAIKGWLGRRDDLEHMPFCGCAVGAVEGCLYVLGGFSKVSVMKCVWRYDPCINQWQEVSPMNTRRALCKTSILNNKLYVVGGFSRSRQGLTPLQSAEVYDPARDLWAQMPSMPFSKAPDLPTAFLAEMLKPFATGMTSYRGRLCVPQSLYSWPLFVDVAGEIYDPKIDSWVDMPAGMGVGWPAKLVGEKLSVVVDGELYALDPSNSSDSGKIKVYDYQEDAWKVVIRKVPVNDFTDPESSYLLAAFHGKLHVIKKDDNNHTLVMQADMKKHICSSSSTLLSSPADSGYENQDVPVEAVAEPDIWKIVAAKDLRATELVSCQVLNI